MCFVVLSLAHSLRLQEPVDWETGNGSGPGGTGQNETGPGQRGDSNAGKYRGADTSGRYSLLFFLVASFLQSATMGRAGREMTNACGESNAGRGTTNASSGLFCSSSPLFFLLALLPDYLLFREVGFDNGRAGARPTGPTWAAIETGDETGGEGSTGTCHVILFFLLALLLFNFLKHSNRRGWAIRNGTDAGGDRKAGQNGGRGDQRVCVMSLFVICSIYFFFSLSSFSLSTAQQQAGLGGT